MMISNDKRSSTIISVPPDGQEEAVQSSPSLDISIAMKYRTSSKQLVGFYALIEDCPHPCFVNAIARHLLIELIIEDGQLYDILNGCPSVFHIRDCLAQILSAIDESPFVWKRIVEFFIEEYREVSSKSERENFFKNGEIVKYVAKTESDQNVKLKKFTECGSSTNHSASISSEDSGLDMLKIDKLSRKMVRYGSVDSEMKVLEKMKISLESSEESESENSEKFYRTKARVSRFIKLCKELKAQELLEEGIINQDDFKIDEEDEEKVSKDELKADIKADEVDNEDEGISSDTNAVEVDKQDLKNFIARSFKFFFKSAIIVVVFKGHIITCSLGCASAFHLLEKPSIIPWTQIDSDHSSPESVYLMNSFRIHESARPIRVNITKMGHLSSNLLICGCGFWNGLIRNVLKDSTAYDLLNELLKEIKKLGMDKNEIEQFLKAKLKINDESDRSKMRYQKVFLQKHLAMNAILIKLKNFERKKEEVVLGMTIELDGQEIFGLSRGDARQRAVFNEKRQKPREIPFQWKLDDYLNIK